jgi:hypothetical protein
MVCHQCGLANPDDGRRNCERCHAHLAVKPGTGHNDLLQLSRDEFRSTLADGLPLIYGNVTALWNEAQEIAALGNRRAVGILQLFAEEEAAKLMLLFDALRCPRARAPEFRRLVKGFLSHLAKGIYVRYYGLHLGDLLEAKRIVELERQEVYREGEYREFIAPNSILYNREKRLYVSYMREADNTHRWDTPYPPDLLFGDIVPSGLIRITNALHHVGLLSEPALAVVEDHWNAIDIGDPQLDPNNNVTWFTIREANLRMLQEWEVRRGQEFQDEYMGSIRIIRDELLFPLYPFDLSPAGDVRNLPPPDEPDHY